MLEEDFPTGEHQAGFLGGAQSYTVFGPEQAGHHHYHQSLQRMMGQAA